MYLVFCLVIFVGLNLGQARMINRTFQITSMFIEEWQEFKLRHNKFYNNPAEEKRKMKIFLENRHIVAHHNTKYHQGLVSYQLGLNEYSDMLYNDFVNSRNGFIQAGENDNGDDQPDGNEFIVPANVELPKSFDWREHGAVTPVKNQGNCGSCWAFSSTGALEGQHFRQTGELISLSEQNLLDCTRDSGNQGCDGGWMSISFDYVAKSGGIDTEESYPYKADLSDKCHFRLDKVGAKDHSFTKIPKGDELKLQAAVATVGPISVAIDASGDNIHLYQGGVYYDSDCSSTNVDHAVLLVGYGTTKDGRDYWLIKNSWGESWGEKGYMKLARNKNNLCGIASYASYPNV